LFCYFWIENIGFFSVNQAEMTKTRLFAFREEVPPLGQQSLQRKLEIKLVFCWNFLNLFASWKMLGRAEIHPYDCLLYNFPITPPFQLSF